MTNAFKKHKLLCLLFVAALFYACNSGDKNEGSSTTSTPASTESTPPSTAVKAAALTGYLDTLWVRTDSFLKLPNRKLVFSFAFRDPDTLTLYGWYCRGVICVGSYSNQTYPDIQLIKGRQSTVAYGPNVTFGNIILSNVKKIQDQADGAFKYVIFAPGKYGDFIKYDIYLSNDDPKQMIHVLAVTATGVEANPSPPRTY